MSNWIDFRKLRQEVNLPALLQHYGVRLRISHSQGQGFCPLPTHRGQRRSPSFSVNFDKRIWQCFGCKARGNAIDFAVRMEGHNPSDTRAVREVAEMLQRDFVSHGSRAPTRQPTEPVAPGQGKAPEREPAPGAEGAMPVLLNSPLDFRLRNLDARHPYLKERHLKPGTIDHFGLGFCSLGMFKDRIVIPLHDASGKLIGYAGRVVDENAINAENPKYRFPGRREYHGKLLEFHKNLFVFNGYRVRSATNIVIVEGFFSTFWLWQCGYPATVAVMGSSCSKEQAELIVQASAPDGTVWVMSDGNAAGNQCAASILEQVASRRKVEWLQLHQELQPTDLSLRELRKLIPFSADKSGTSFKPHGAKRQTKHREV
jgi:DNA primase